MTPTPNSAEPRDLSAALWHTYQQGRGTADALLHQDYVLALFFLKCLDQAALLPPRRGSSTSHALSQIVVPAVAQFSRLVAQRLVPELGTRLNEAFRVLTEANPEVLAQAFAHLNFAQPPHVTAAAAGDRYLQQQLVLIDALPLQGNTRELGRAASALLTRVARHVGKPGTAWCTPPEVAELLARLLAPQAGEQFSDPHCGSGALLEALAEQVGGQPLTLSGQEPDPAAYGRCRLRLLLQGVTPAQLACGDSLADPRLLAGSKLQQFDAVATQLPLGPSAWNREEALKNPCERFWRGVPPATQSDFAYISHVLATIQGPQGRAGLLLGHGALFRTGQDGKIRQQLLEENLLDAVIGLPAQVLPGFNSPLAILLFRRGRTRQDVLFVQVSEPAALDPAGSPLTDACLNQVVQCYHTYDAALPYARCVSPEELRQNQYNLSPARYVSAPAPELNGNWHSTQAEIQRLLAELHRVQAELLPCLHALGIAEANAQ